jgi:hypothetical protein
MSESIAEMVIPGTYIEVRAEGLIGVGGIVTGNIGIVGTAARGPVGKVRTISSMADALDLYGLPDNLDPTKARLTGSPLTLTRTLQQAFDGGARNVLVVRAANGTATPATLDIAAADGPAFTLAAKGTGDDDSSGTWGQDLTVKVVVDATAPDVCQLTVTYRKRSEVFAGANTEAVFNALAGSSFVTASGLDHKTSLLKPMAATPLAGGTDGADVSVSDVAEALALLEEQPVNILLVAGMSAKTIGNVVQGHLARTLNEGRERIAILGADQPGSATDAGKVIEDADALENDRVVLVAPGMRIGEEILPPSYLAAVVAGKLSTLAPHISLTNKTLPATVDVRYSSGVVSTLLGKQVLVVRQKYGTQVVQGITTSAPPFRPISVRRTVDYAKAGVRLGSDPYIGRLNNARVRAALQATLDGFLSQMVLDEMLIGYELSVTATRPQEIAGICSVVMNLKPTFSIDFIRVTMNLE